MRHALVRQATASVEAGIMRDSKPPLRYYTKHTLLYWIPLVVMQSSHAITTIWTAGIGFCLPRCMRPLCKKKYPRLESPSAS